MTKSNENLSFGLGSAKLADELAGRSEVPDLIDYESDGYQCGYETGQTFWEEIHF